VSALRVEGAQRTNPEAIARELRERAGVVEGRPVSDGQLLRGARILHGWGEFERVDVRTRMDEVRRSVVVEVEEKPWGPDYLRVGGRAVSDFQTDARFALTLQHTRTWINSWGAEWRNELTLGDTRRIATSFFQPLGPGSPWFAEAQVGSVKFSSDLFDAGFRRTDRITLTQTGVSGALGLRLGTSGVTRLGAGYERYRVTPLISSNLEGITRDSARYVRGSVRFDTLDDANFPRRGYVVEGFTSSVRYAEAGGDPVQTYQVGGVFPLTFGRLTFLGLANAARSVDDRGGFGLGGFLNLSGTPAGAVTGSQAVMLAGLAYYRLGEFLPRALGRSLYAGFSLEAGNAWQRKSDIDYGRVRKAGSVFLGFDSIIGPMYFGWGHTYGGSSALYLFLGRPVDQFGSGP
jgi:NTE family protein